MSLLLPNSRRLSWLRINRCLASALAAQIVSNMDYKSMIKSSAEKGGDEKAMWASVDVTEEAMEYIREKDPAKYECLMRKLHESLFGKHYCEEMALHDVEKMHSLGADGTKHVGVHWTADQVEAATKDKTFPASTTKWDKFVGYNATWHDLRKKFTDEQILAAAHLLWFADEDWHSDGKIWDYMGINAVK